MSESGITKGAILMLALGEEGASEVMKYLGPREVQKLGEAMTTMKSIPQEEVENVLDDFNNVADQNSSLGWTRTTISAPFSDGRWATTRPRRC